MRGCFWSRVQQPSNAETSHCRAIRDGKQVQEGSRQLALIAHQHGAYVVVHTPHASQGHAASTVTRVVGACAVQNACDDEPLLRAVSCLPLLVSRLRTKREQNKAPQTRSSLIIPHSTCGHHGDSLQHRNMVTLSSLSGPGRESPSKSASARLASQTNTGSIVASCLSCRRRLFVPFQ